MISMYFKKMISTRIMIINSPKKVSPHQEQNALLQKTEDTKIILFT